MGSRSDIGWRSRDSEGRRIEVRARKEGAVWKISQREKRFETWQPYENPPLEEWETLLDAVQRRIARQLLRPEEEERLKALIAQSYPDAAL